MRKSQKGFTLIELLIVIVIIGILAGVLIAIIDPASQQNRARDAGVEATLNKVALATQGYISAYGDVPTDDQFLGSLDNADDLGTSCAGGAGDYECVFTVDGNPLSADCSTSWSGTGTNQCGFHYLGENVNKRFVINAKSYGLANTMFEYSSEHGEILRCALDGSDPGTESRCDTL